VDLVTSCATGAWSSPWTRRPSGVLVVVRGGLELLDGPTKEAFPGLRVTPHGFEGLMADAEARRRFEGRALVERASLEDIVVLMEGGSSMLRSLLLRDLTLHRRVLAISALVPLLLLSSLGLVPKNNQEGFPAVLLMLGLILLSCLPASLHLREGLLGTLATSWPARARRDLVRLRYLEGSSSSAPSAPLLPGLGVRGTPPSWT